MIISSIKGGLGNQLFQWSYGFYLSKKYSTDFYLDVSFYKNQRYSTKRFFSLDKFNNIKYNILPNQYYKNSIKVTDNFNYFDLKYNKNFNYYLDGYWQSEKYFKEYENDIIKILSPDESFVEKINEKYKMKNSLSIHIRRTDYLKHSDIHPIQEIDYYNKALDVIKDYNKIMIFSDDINWCKNNLNFENMIFIENNNDIEDMWIMSMCDNNIIANSSFSWWGAWLNKNKNKKVIAPSKWFGDKSGLNSSDIIPNNWIKI